MSQNFRSLNYHPPSAATRVWGTSGALKIWPVLRKPARPLCTLWVTEEQRERKIFPRTVQTAQIDFATAVNVLSRLLPSFYSCIQFVSLASKASLKVQATFPSSLLHFHPILKLLQRRKWDRIARLLQGC